MRLCIGKGKKMETNYIFIERKTNNSSEGRSEYNRLRIIVMLY